MRHNVCHMILHTFWITGISIFTILKIEFMTKIHKPLKMRQLGAHCMKSITNVDMPVYMI